MLIFQRPCCVFAASRVIILAANIKYLLCCVKDDGYGLRRAKNYASERSEADYGGVPIKFNLKRCRLKMKSVADFTGWGLVGNNEV